jgi:hypothetical protein
LIVGTINVFYEQELWKLKGENMKKNLFFAAIVIGLIILSSNSMAATYGGGSGTTVDPYQIWTAEQMNTIGLNTGDWASSFKLMADIDMSAYTGTQYNLIGTSTTRFTGTFDGNGYVIRNLTYTTTEENPYIGVISYIGTGGMVYNLGVENISLSTGGDWVGGIAGYNYFGTIMSCYVTGSVKGVQGVGGLVGRNSSGTITTCYAADSVTGTSFYVAGLVGHNNAGAITNCYSVGLVTASSTNVGGLVGANSGTVTNCFWDTQTSTKATSAGGTGKNTALMKTLSTFTAAGWDFSASDGDAADWWMPYLDYPRFPWQPHFGGGSGTVEDPYLIYTAVQMNTIGLNSDDWSASFKLMADIDMSAYTGILYNIIGDSTTAFTGVFEGNGHTLTGVIMNQPARNGVGLFGIVGSGGLISHVCIKNANVIGNTWVGILCGRNYYGTITQCNTGGTVTGNANNVGGLCGENWGLLSQCYATGTVAGGSHDNIGGLCGGNRYATISQCYATSSVTGHSYVGGLCGGNEVGTITQSYSIGAVTGTGAIVGGLCGGNYDGTVTTCFWDTETSGRPSSSGGTGKTTAQMKTYSTFTAAGWDFVNAWGIVNLQTYPLLNAFSGNINPADINYSGTVDLQDLTILAANWLTGV